MSHCGAIGTILGQAIVSSSANTDFCGIAGGSNAGFESLFCAGTCEVVGVGGVRAIPSSHIAELERELGAQTLARRVPWQPRPLESTLMS